jgi:hypothetical protein
MVKNTAVHGGVEFLGKGSAIKNLNLDELALDPTSPGNNQVWYNLNEKRIKYIDGNDSDGVAVLKAVAHTDDIVAVTQVIDSKASMADVSVSNITYVNVTNSDMVFGQPIYGVTQLTADLANAGSNAKKNVVGLVSDLSINSQNGSGKVKTSGELIGTHEQWAVVTGATGGLVPNANYFLDIISGRLTLSPPTEEGQAICLLGRALSTTSFLIRIERPISL